MVFKLKIANVIGSRIYINNLRIWHRDIDVEKPDREAYDENRKAYMFKYVEHD